MLSKAADASPGVTLAVQSVPSSDGVITAKVSGMVCQFLIDSGSQVNTVTHTVFKDLIDNVQYSKGLHNIQQGTDRPLKAYAKSDGIHVMCTFEAFLEISDDRPILLEKFYVVKEQRSLLSRATSTRYSVLLLGLKVPVDNGRAFGNIDDRWTHIGCIGVVSEEPAQFPKFNIPPIKIPYDTSKPACRNIFTNIPAAMKQAVQQRLEEQVSAGIIERVTDSMDVAFCSSMLVVPKGNDDFRLVIDLRGPNRYILRSPYTMPTLEKILVQLQGAQWFSTIDLQSAFFHIELEEDSRHLTNFMTEFGMYRYIRLPFGLSNAPDVFQEVMERKILADCEGVLNYLDDILVFGRSKEEHDKNLAIVMDRLADHNVKINASKCVFGSQKVRFLGFELTDKGWRIEQGKLSAIKNFRRPSSCAEVKSFLGLITFVDRFLVHRATKTERLRALANADAFYWTEAEEIEFESLKNHTVEAIKVLGYYSCTDFTELYVDASAVGLGAVLVQHDTNGTPRIIACASKSLTTAEAKYPQSHREALAVVWGVERFSFYLIGRPFVIRSDASSNEFIFHSNYRIGKRAFTRAEGYALRLLPYKFRIERVKGEENVADALSRLIQDTQPAVPFEENCSNHVLCTLDAGCMEITMSEIESSSERDQEMELLRNALDRDVWPTELRGYEAQRKQIHKLGSLLCKDDRIILPANLRRRAMESAHGGHIGEVAMKRIMREFFWWPKMSKETENFVKSCETCVLLSKQNPPVPLASRELPEGPWEILQIDFLSVPGFGTGEFLMVIDTYSRFLSVTEMQRTNADATNTALIQLFKRWGFPRIIQSDNGPPFQSSAFCEFWEAKNVKVRKSIPLSPQSNGMIERYNQPVIKTLSAAKLEGRSWRLALDTFVHNHNTLVPHSRLKVTPFELLVGWKFRGTFPSLWGKDKDLDRVDVREADAEQKLTSSKHADQARGAMPSDVRVGDRVFLKQQKKTKSDATFGSEKYTVLAQDGSKVVICSENGVQYTRSVNDLKKVPFPTSSAGDSQVTSSTLFDSYSNDDLAGDHATERDGNVGSRTGLRNRGSVKKPSRYNDDYIYNISD